MVHALRQAHRVLKDGGYLLDLRPAPVQRHVFIETDDSYQQVATMEERLDDLFAADRAVNEMVRAGHLTLKSRNRFECTRRMDSYREFRSWLEEPGRLRKLSSPERLLETVNRALKAHRGKRRIVVLGPLDLRVLTKSGKR